MHVGAAPTCICGWGMCWSFIAMPANIPAVKFPCIAAFTECTDPALGDEALLDARLIDGVEIPSLPSSSVEVASSRALSLQSRLCDRPSAVKGSDVLRKKDEPRRRLKSGTLSSACSLPSFIISTKVFRTTYTGAAIGDGESIHTPDMETRVRNASSI